MRILVAFVLALVFASTASAQPLPKPVQKPNPIEGITERMVTIVYQPPDEKSITITGWLVDNNVVITMYFPNSAGVTVDGKPVKILKSDFPNRLSLMNVAGKKATPITVVSAVPETVIAIDSYSGRLIFGILGKPEAAGNFLRVPNGAQLTPGAGLFDSEGRLVSVVGGFEGSENKYVLAAEPRAVRAILGK